MEKGSSLLAVLFLVLNSVSLPGSPPAGPAGLAGEVYDPHGLVIVNAQVRLLAGAQDSFSNTELREVNTDSQGRFHFRLLNPGLYRLKACAVGFQCEESSVEIGDAAADP
ncbi:MAG: carboxypeptidase regulatory-like domain-containing protein, partial [Acidobacteria bacterium]|nr:carboxypeptidase regulatory-like domain-containing protein [Acidobacteriota bacterium]